MAQDINVAYGGNYYFTLGSSATLSELEFHVQGVSGMGIAINEIQTRYQGILRKMPGEEIQWNPLSLEIVVDEHFDIVENVYNYIQQIHNFETNEIGEADFTGYLYLTTNRNNPHRIVEFYNCWLSSMSDIQFAANQMEAQPITATVELQYDWYKILTLE